MGEGEGLRVYRKRDDRVRRRSEDNPKEEGGRGRGLREEGRGKGRGTGWAEDLLIRGISEEGPIFNIKDESNRSKDDPK